MSWYTPRKLADKTKAEKLELKSGGPPDASWLRAIQ